MAPPRREPRPRLCGQSLNLFGALEPQWHRTVRTLYVGAFVLVWLEALGSFLFFLILTRSASPVPTPHLVASVANHGNVFYVASLQKHLYDLMLTTMFFAIPGIMLTGFILPTWSASKSSPAESSALFTEYASGEGRDQLVESGRQIGERGD